MNVIDGNPQTGVLEAKDPDTAMREPVGMDTSTKSLRVNAWVWDTVGLTWTRMTQPTVDANNIDLTVSMGDVEKLLSDSYLLAKQFDYTSGNLDYIGYNTVLAATDAATTWRVYKLTWVSGNCTKILGPAGGSWTGRAGLF